MCKLNRNIDRYKSDPSHWDIVNIIYSSGVESEWTGGSSTEKSSIDMDLSWYLHFSSFPIKETKILLTFT